MRGTAARTRLIARVPFRSLLVEQITKEPGPALGRGPAPFEARWLPGSVFREFMSGVEAMRQHREGRLTLRTHRVEPIVLPTLEPDVVRETREALHMSRRVFAYKLGVNPRTLERWEQGRSKPNEQAAALIWLVRKYPDTLERLESLSASA